MSIKNCFKCKTMQQLVAESGTTHGMERTLGAFQLVMLGIGAIVGVGIYVCVGLAAGKHAGPAVVISFAIAGLACTCVALCYAELAAAIPISGSSYTFTYATLGELPAFLISGIILITYCLCAASVASGWSGYMQSFLADYGVHVPAIFAKSFGTVISGADGSVVTAIIDLPALVMVSLISLLVFFGTEASVRVNTIIVIIKMTVLLTFVIVGATKIAPANWQPFIPANTGVFGEFGWSGIISGAGVILLAYTGFDVVASAAQETKNPQRNLPIGIVGSLSICVLVYMIVAIVLTGVVSYTELNVADPLAVAVDKMNIAWLIKVIKIGAIVGLTSVVLALIYASVRITFAITNDGLLPKQLAKVHPKFHTPYVATVMVGLVITVFSCLLPVGQLIQASSFGLSLTFVVVCIANIYLRYKQPHLPREFKCPLMPIIPVVGIILFSAIIFSLPSKIFYMEIIWLLFLLAIYFGYSRHHSLCQQDVAK